MFLSISTTHRPATDLGFLLMKHPERVFEVELGFGKAVVFYPEASEARCEAVLTLEVDPVGLVRGRGDGEGMLDQYVNDRPYAASSFLAVGLNRAFRTAMSGVSKERVELAAQKIPLTVKVCPLPLRGGEELLATLFEPLGWRVSFERVQGPHASSRYVSLTLEGEQRVAEALSHLYVLIPVLDDDKHYWSGDDEVDKLLAKAGAWLSGHPAKEVIAKRYLHRRSLVRAALARLASEDQVELEAPEVRQSREEALEKAVRLNDLRLDAVVEALAASGAKFVTDLGCGEGKLLGRLMRDRRFERIIGLDASSRALEMARDRLKLDMAGGLKRERVTLLHGALTYRDERWAGSDAVSLVEVIEHLDADRLPALEKAVFGVARPKTIIVTTPNAEYNVLFETLASGAFRHPDHRFEWTRADFEAWAGGIAQRHGYAVNYSGIGVAHAEHGAPTQMAVFVR
jgi:3' terminal RNA ribose 2'-O-methyltransferase Hen1